MCLCCQASHCPHLSVLPHTEALEQNSGTALSTFSGLSVLVPSDAVAAGDDLSNKYIPTLVKCSLGGSDIGLTKRTRSTLTEGNNTPASEDYIVHLSAGFTHSVAVTHLGALYTWGTGEHGELGRGQYSTFSGVPELTDGLIQNTIVLSAACGLHHCVALTVSAVWKEINCKTSRQALHGTASVMVHDQSGAPLLFCIGGEGDSGVHSGFQVVKIVEDQSQPLQWIEPVYQGDTASPRVYHTATLVQDKVLVWGGLDSNHEPANPKVTMLKIGIMTWSTPETDGQTPTARAMHSATAMGTSLVVFGGSAMASGKPLGDLAILDTSQGVYSVCFVCFVLLIL